MSATPNRSVNHNLHSPRTFTKSAQQPRRPRNSLSHPNGEVEQQPPTPPRIYRNMFIYFSLHTTSWDALEKELEGISNIQVLELLLRVPPGKHGFRNTGRDEIWNQLKPRFQWLTTVTLRFERGNVDKFNSRFQNILDVFNGQKIPNIRHVTVRFEDNMEIGHDNYDFLIDAIASFKYLDLPSLYKIL